MVSSGVQALEVDFFVTVAAWILVVAADLMLTPGTSLDSLLGYGEAR